MNTVGGEGMSTADSDRMVPPGCGGFGFQTSRTDWTVITCPVYLRDREVKE